MKTLKTKYKEFLQNLTKQPITVSLNYDGNDYYFVTNGERVLENEPSDGVIQVWAYTEDDNQEVIGWAKLDLNIKTNNLYDSDVVNVDPTEEVYEEPYFYLTA